MNNVFFENGFMTSTEAQNICNIAKEAVTNEHERLSAVSFYDTEIASIISPEAFIKTKISPNDISWISESLDKIGRYNALNAWLKEAIKNNAASVIMVHNHPSGDPTPSKEDIFITRRMIEAGKIMDIPVLDHVIIGNNRYTSLKETGHIKGDNTAW